MTKTMRALLAAGLCLSLTGCIHAPEVSLDNAAEVAMDDAGYDKDQVKDLETEDNGKEFVISFKSPNGAFHYTVGHDGLITSRHYDKNSEAAQSEKPAEPAKETSKAPETPKASSAAHSEPEPVSGVRTPTEQHALNLALNNAGLTEDDVQDIAISVSPDGAEAEVTFFYGPNENIVTIDLVNSVVTNAYVQ